MAKTTIKPVNIYLNMLVNLEKVKETKDGVSVTGQTDQQHTFNFPFESEEALFEWCEKNPEFGAKFKEMYEAGKKKL